MKFFILLVGILMCGRLYADALSISSPNGRVVVEVDIEKKIVWRAGVGETQILDWSELALKVDGKWLGHHAQLRSVNRSSVDQVENPIVPVKSSTIRNNYNQLDLNFKDGYSVVFRVFDNGVAYRFKTAIKGDILIDDEIINLHFNDDNNVLFPEEESLQSHYERLYIDQPLTHLNSGRFCSLPALINAENNVKIGITEADLFDYPCLFLESTGNKRLISKFPRVILESEKNGDRAIEILKEGEYIAKTSGNRSFPWRVFMISEHDAELVENQMVYLLSRKNKLAETSWIKPGLVAWDWWNDNNIYKVGFKSGLNNNTYKYFIDFASEYDIPYVMLDEGWSKTTTNVLEPNPEINIEELVAYGNQKGVRLILWTLWGPLDEDMSIILDRFQEWGVAGVKVDFMTRADQYMVNFYERVARECAKRQLFVDYHGAFKPSGLHVAYPNILNYEGVKGLESYKLNGLIDPNHEVQVCFTRMLSGPLDYTPGALINVHEDDFKKSYHNPMSKGTRCHQLALYVIYDAPLQMLADSPTRYYAEDETTRFISQMKTVWDDTKVLDAKVGEYIVTARRSGEDWYIGAITNNDPRNLKVDLSFLNDGNYRMEVMEDGINASKVAMDFSHFTQSVSEGSKVVIKMVSGGGWVAVIKKVHP
ncbi:glycoside hydrolase family 97 protein [Reichenbachiella sp.]|uniref:glycoside hydrolase family 97 protein n=1 Tax=Reichenbachiella sp. TaxID=2184521 RepID=UPI003265262B